MTLPNYLSGAPGYRNDAAVVDVQTIIDNLTTLVTGLTPPWTNPGAGHVVSPVDASSRKMDLVFTRISATSLQVVATDNNGRSLTRRANIAGGGSSVDYYAGQFHLFLDWLNGATPEFLHLALLDESPELQTSHNKWLRIHGNRNSAGADLSNTFAGYSAIVDSSAAFAEKALAVLYPQAVTRNVNNDGKLCTRTHGGANVLYPLIQMGDTVSGQYKILGKVYQVLFCSSVRFADGAEFTVPLDESTTGVFKVLHLPVPASNNPTKMAARKS